SVAGFVQGTTLPAGAWPNAEFDGGGASLAKLLNAIAQPGSPAVVQNLMFLKVPPTSLPVGAYKRPLGEPMSKAEIILPRSMASESMLLVMRLMSFIVPWECPMSTKRRPLL